MREDGQDGRDARQLPKQAPKKDGRVQAHAVPESFAPYGEHSLLLHHLKA